jgi:poly(A) polymerase
MDDLHDDSDPPAPPVVLIRPGHPIHRAGIDPDALRIMSRLQRMGFISYLCGGAVRDLMLGRRPKDFDVATDARPGQIKKRFANVFVIGRRFRLAHVHFPGGKIIEVATFRRDPDPETTGLSATTGLSETTRSPDPHAIYGTPREDAFRRDITINALYYDPAIDAVIDYVGGLEDLRCRRVRMIGDPGRRFTEDPIRVWRVLRHAARLGFDVEATAARAIHSHRHLLASVSGSRLYEEFNKDLAYETRPVFEALRTNGLLRHFLGKAGHDYETDPALFARIASLLDVEERARKEGCLLSLEEMYALVFWPWVEPLFKDDEEDMALALSAAFQDAGMKMTIPKTLRANAVQILVIVDGLIRALRTGRPRAALLHRAHLPQATRLLFLIEKDRPPAEGESFESLFREAHPEAPLEAQKKRRRRRRRGSRSGGGERSGEDRGGTTPESA